MGIEALSVVFAAVLVWLSALVQNLSNASERGHKYVMSDRSVSPPLQGFFGRATRTLANSIESALMWVPPVVVILMLHRTNWISQLSAEAYIGVGVVFALSYWLKNPGRTVVRLACRHGLLRGRRCVGRRPPHVDR